MGGTMMPIAIGAVLAVPMIDLLLEDRKLIPGSAVAMDQFGHSVAVDGAIALVGALFDDGRGTSSGTAFLYDTDDGSLLDALFGNDTGAGDTFGDGVALGNGRAFVGAPQEGSDGTFAGAAYAFRTSNGNQTRRLRPMQVVFVGENPTGSAFGWSLGVSENWLAIGAPGDIEGANGGGGAIYIYNGLGTSLVGKFFADDAGFADNLGRAIAVDADYVVAAAPFDDDRGNSSGSVYVFDAATGTQLHKLTASDGAAGDFFGLSVDIDNGIVVVGAPFANARGVDSGAVYVFDAATGQQRLKLLGEETTSGDQFGSAVAIDGGTLAVGARIDDTSGLVAGAGYVFDATSGVQLATLLASDGQTGDTLGNAIAISQRTIVCGAEGVDDAGDFAGAAYVFSIPDSIPLCPADLDDDGRIAAADAATLVADLGTAGADINRDSVTDMIDVALLQRALDLDCP